MILIIALKRKDVTKYLKRKTCWAKICLKLKKYKSIYLISYFKDLFQKLLDDYVDFKIDPLSAYKALDCAAVAWYLTDWVYHEYENPTFPNVGIMRSEFYKTCGDLKTLHDIATGLKHFTITHPKSSMSGSHLHKGGFSMGFSFGFNISRLEILYSDKASEAIDLILESVVNICNYFPNKINSQHKLYFSSKRRIAISKFS